MVSNDKKPSEGETLDFIKCGESGHRANECKNKVMRCFKCGKTGHCIVDCKSGGLTC